MRYIICRKLGMVQVFGVDGKLFPTIVVQCEDNKIISKKDILINIGFEEIDDKKLNKPQKWHFKKLGVKPYKINAEFVNVDSSININALININTFYKGEYADIQGITKGGGYTGAIVR